jgi:hypothetical protein
MPCHCNNTAALQHGTAAARGTEEKKGHLREESAGVAGEHGGLADVLQAKVEHDDSLQADASASVGQCAVPEGVHVALDGCDGDVECVGALDQHVHVMDALGAGHDLLAADEQVVAVGPPRVLGVGHGVEGARGLGVLVHHVEVSAELLAHQLAQGLLIGGADVLVEGRIHASFL